MTHDITVTLDLSSYSDDTIDFDIWSDQLISSENLVINWGDNTSETASPHEDIIHTYQSGNIYTITIDGVSDIGDGFLSQQNGDITEVVLSSNITTIGNEFCTDTHITEMIIPNSITSIGANFCIGTDIAEIVIPENVTSIGEGFCAESALNAIHIPSNVTTIDRCFCYMCSNLRAVSFSTGLTEVGEDFVGKTLVSRLEFPEGLSISGGFSDAPNINTIIYPSSIDDIGMLAFDNANFDPQKIVFKSHTPPATENRWENFDGIVYVPEGCINSYIEYAIETNTFPVDSSYYKENLTLPRALDKLGSRIRNNLQTKGVSSNSNDGLTTLANKIQDIELNNMTGFLADIGFYDQDNWSGTPPTILKDKIIFHGNAEFPFNNVVFPDTFTWSFILTTHDKGDELTEPITIGQYHSLYFEESVDMEFCIRITRENGGAFIIKCDETDDEIPFGSLSFKSLLITPYGAKPVTISEIYFSEEYDDNPYSIISYNLCWDNLFHTMPTDIWDNDSDTKPTSVPLLLLKNGTPFKSYSLTEATDNFIFRDKSLVLVNYRHHCWGNYHYIFSSEMSTYSWKTIKDIGCQLEFKDNREDLYFPIKHFKKGISVDESNRLDNYFHNLIVDGYDEVNLQDYDILPWRDERFDYQIVRKTPISLSSPELFFTFEYIKLDEANNDVGIFIHYTGPTANDSLLFYISNDMFTISRNDNDICSSEKLVFQDYNIITIYQYLSRDYTLLWEIELNGNSVLSYTSNIFRQKVYTLQRQCYQNNAKISNFYYGSLDGV